MAPTPPASDADRRQVDRRQFSGTHVIEATTATVLAAAILGTAGGMGWLVVALPSQLTRMQEQITRIVQNQAAFGNRFANVEQQVDDHERRLIRLESR